MKTYEPNRLGLKNTLTASLLNGKTRPSPKTKQSDGEAPILELCDMWSTPSFPLLPWLPCPGVVASDSVLSMDQIEIFDI